MKLFILVKKLFLFLNFFNECFYILNSTSDDFEKFLGWFSHIVNFSRFWNQAIHSRV